MTGSNVEKNFIFGIPLVDLPTYRVAPPVENKFIPAHDGVNLPLLNEILKHIQTHPTQWMQDAWYKIVDLDTGDVRYETEEQIVEEQNSCGAAFCFAGHVALREGFPSPPKDNNSEWDRWVATENGYFSTTRQERGRHEDVSEFAERRLGVSASVADVLFNGDNDLETLEDVVLALNLNPNLSGYDLRDIRDRNIGLEEGERTSVRDFMIVEGLLLDVAA